MKISKEDIKKLAEQYTIEYAALMAFLATETPLQGFDSRSGKLLIQFEKSWFKKLLPDAEEGDWAKDTVGVQSKEWKSFNSAFKIDPTIAMLATSIGMPQIMGMNFKEAGYDSVDHMWNSFKTGEYAQVEALCRFIKNKKLLYKALQLKDWHNVASIYNGAGYKQLAIKLGREPYDITLKKNYDKYNKDN